MIQLIIVSICVAVFAATSIITILALIGRIKISKTYLNVLFTKLILEIVAICIFGFADYMTKQSNCEGEGCYNVENNTPNPINDPGAEIEIIKKYQDDSSAWNFIRKNTKSINELYISGAHLRNGVFQILNPIKEILVHEGVVNIIITDPNDSVAISNHSARDLRPNENKLKSDIESTLSDLKKIKKELPNAKLNVYTINFTLDERIHLMVHDNFSRTAFVKLYPFRNPNTEGTYKGGLFFYIQEDSVKNHYSTFDYYNEKIRGYLEVAKPYNLSEQ